MAVYKRDGKGRIIKSRNGAGTWWYDFTHKSKRYKKALKGITTKVQAERLEMEARLAVLEGRYDQPSQRIGFEAYAKEVYLKWAQQRKRSVRGETVHLTEMCSHFKSKLLREITTADINNYLQMRRGQITLRGTQRTGASVNRERALLSVLFNHAISEGYCSANPVKGIKRFKEDGQRKRVLSLKEETRLFAALTGLQARLRPMALLALGAGLRCGEIVGLRWEDVDFNRGTLYLRPAITKNGEGGELPLNADVHAALKELQAEKSRGRIFAYNANAISMQFANLCDRLGLADVTLHVLRHTFASRLIERNVNPLIVKRLMRHKTMAMTDYYTHVSQDQLQQAVKTLENGAECSANVPPSAPKN
jgi:integrase